MRKEIVVKQIHDDVEFKHSYFVKIEDTNTYRFFTKYDDVKISYPEKHFSNHDSLGEYIQNKSSEKPSSITDLFKSVRENMSMWVKYGEEREKETNKCT